MIRPAFRHLALLAALPLPVLTPAAGAQTFFFDNAAVHGVVSRDTVIGYANESDYISKTHGASPIVRFSNSDIHGFMYLFQSSSVDVQGSRIDGWLIANGNSTLTVRDGSASRLQTRDNSLVNLIEGSLAGLEACGKSQVTLRGGSIGKNLLARDSSRVNLRGGNVAGNLMAYDHSDVNVMGGEIGGRLLANGDSAVTLRDGGFAEKVVVFDNSVVNLSGSAIKGNLEANGNTRINLSGGVVAGDVLAYNNSRVTISGGSIKGRLKVYENSRINFCGTELRVALTHPDAYWVYGACTEYTLSGKHSDGTSLNGKTLLLDVSKGAYILFNGAPVRIAYPRFQSGGR